MDLLNLPLSEVKGMLMEKVGIVPEQLLYLGSRDRASAPLAVGSRLPSHIYVYKADMLLEHVVVPIDEIRAIGPMGGIVTIPPSSPLAMRLNLTSLSVSNDGLLLRERPRLALTDSHVALIRKWKRAAQLILHGLEELQAPCCAGLRECI